MINIAVDIEELFLDTLVVGGNGATANIVVADEVIGGSLQAEFNNLTVNSLTIQTTTQPPLSAPSKLGVTTNLNADLVADIAPSTTDTPDTVAQRTSTGAIVANQFTVTGGTAPVTTTNAVKITNLNADSIRDGAFIRVPSDTNTPNTLIKINGSGRAVGTTITSTVSGVLAPFIVNSSTRVDNLNADLLDGLSRDRYVDISHTNAAVFKHGYEGLNIGVALKSVNLVDQEITVTFTRGNGSDQIPNNALPLFATGGSSNDNFVIIAERPVADTNSVSVRVTDRNRNFGDATESGTIGLWYIRQEITNAP